MFVHHIGDHAANIGKLAHAGRFDDDAIGVVFVHQFIQRAAEIAHQRAADAAGVQFRYLNAGILHEAAVYANFAIFVFQQDNALAFKGTAQQLLDQGGFACAQEAGNNINLRHMNHLFPSFFTFLF